MSDITVDFGGAEIIVSLGPDADAAARAASAALAALAQALATFNSVGRAGTIAEREAIPLDQRKEGLQFLVTYDNDGNPIFRKFEWRLAGSPSGILRTGPDRTTDGWEALYTEWETKNLGIGFFGLLPSANVGELTTALSNIVELYQPRIYGFRAVALSTTSPLRAMLEWDGEADGFTLSWGNFSLPVGGGIRAIDTQAFDYDAVRPLLFTGDSMLDGTWTASAAADLARDAVVVAKYSSGAKQVYRLGVRKLFCTAAGNTIPASGSSVAVTSINGVAPSASAVGGNPSSFDLFAAHGFLNTSSGDEISTHCSEAGTWGGRHGIMSVPNGGTPTYAFTPDDGLGASTVPTQSLFVPDNLARLKTHEVTARLSQNYAFAGPGNPVFPNDINPRVLEDLQLIAGETVGQPMTVLGLSPQNNFTTGTPFYIALRYLNGTQANGYTDGQFYQLFGDRYAIVTVGGVKYNNSDYVRWFGRDGSANDQADYDAGINPRSVMETTNPSEVHYNAKGEGLEKAFWILWRQQRKRPPAITSSTLFTLVGTRTQPAIYPEEPVVWTSEPVTAGVDVGYDASRSADVDGLLEQAEQTTFQLTGLVQNTGSLGVYLGAGVVVPEVLAGGSIVRGFRKSDGAQMHYGPLDGPGFTASVAREVAPLTGDVARATVQLTGLDRNTGSLLVYSGAGAVVPEVTAGSSIVRGFRRSDGAQMHYTPLAGPGFSASVAREVTPLITDYKYTGSLIYPVLMLGNQAPIYYDPAVKRVVIHDVLIRGDHGLVTASNWPQLIKGSDGYNGLLVDGQSHSMGALGQPPLSTTQPYNAVTFVGGVKSSSAQDKASFGPLIENSLGEDNATGTNRGETPSSFAAKTAVERAASMAGIAPSDFVIFASNPGKGGTPIAGLIKGTAPYSRLLAQVTSAKAIASASGKAFSVHAVAWLHGGADSDLATPLAIYRDTLIQRAADLNADIKPITGQKTDVHFLVDQECYRLQDITNVQLAIFQAVQKSPLIHFVTPVTSFATAADDLHLIPAGYQHMGAYLGRAYEQLVVEQRVPDCLWPISAVVTGTTLLVRFRVPKAPLVLDVANLPQATDFGFKVVDDNGAVTLSNIQVVGGDTIQFTLGRAPVANCKVRYALDYLGAGIPIYKAASGNLRDSTTDAAMIAGVAKPLWHLAPHFQLDIINLVG